jgi:hypothetical protein
MALASYFPGACADEPSFDEAFVTATLEGTFRCPARRDYIELHFTTSAGPWNWCFPRPARRLTRPAGRSPIALTIGPYGIVARRMKPGGQFGTGLDASVALPAILAGAQVVVARRLVEAGR